MWVVKTKGDSFYVNHVSCDLPWSTKETPGNDHTKGSIKIKRCLLTIDDANEAHITELTPEDEARLKGTKRTIRIITQYGAKLRDFLNGREHGEIKRYGGGCSTLWFVVDIFSEKVLTLAQIALPEVRVLMPNELYYKLYDKEGDDEDDLYED